MTHHVHENVQTGFVYALLFQVIVVALVFCFILIFQSTFSFETFKHLWNAWDGNSYVFLSTHGYVVSGEEAKYIVFYPLYPILTGIVQRLFIEPHLAGVIVTTIGSIVGHTAFYVFLRERGYDNQKARRVLFLFMVNPVTIYFTLICTEGIFFAFCALFFLFLYRRSFVLAAVCGLLASSTRLLGLPLVFAYLAFFIESGAFRTEKSKMLLAATIPLGFVSFLGLNWVLFHTPFYYQEVLRENWFKSVVNPVAQYVQTLRGFSLDLPLTVPTYTIDQIATLITPMIIGVYLFVEKKKVWWTGTVFVVSSLAIVMAQSYWLSNTRYIGMLFPLYIMIAKIGERSRLLYGFVCLGSFALALYGIYLFSIGSWLY